MRPRFSQKRHYWREQKLQAASYLRRNLPHFKKPTIVQVCTNQYSICVSDCASASIRSNGDGNRPLGSGTQEADLIRVEFSLQTVLQIV